MISDSSITGKMELGLLKIFTAITVLVVCTNSQLTGDQLEQITLKARNLPHELCGKSDIFNPKLKDGFKASLGAYPWMGALGYTKKNSTKLFWLCASNLITDQFVITAAHCLNTNMPFFKLSVVRLGDLDLNEGVEDGASPLDIEVEKPIPHPQYNVRKRVNDIGLIKLKVKVQFDYFKKPICLPPPEFYETSFVGFSSAIIGWGRTEGGETTTLLEASVDIKDTDSCRANYTQLSSRVELDERVICASAPRSGSCYGDAGGPLMMYRRFKGKPSMYLLGVYSYGRAKCGTDGYPGVYTNTSTFFNWIIENLEF